MYASAPIHTGIQLSTYKHLGFRQSNHTGAM